MNGLGEALVLLFWTSIVGLVAILAWIGLGAFWLLTHVNLVVK